jgi:hypothetical protein
MAILTFVVATSSLVQVQSSQQERHLSLQIQKVLIA